MTKVRNARLIANIYEQVDPVFALRIRLAQFDCLEKARLSNLAQATLQVEMNRIAALNKQAEQFESKSLTKLKAASQSAAQVTSTDIYRQRLKEASVYLALRRDAADESFEAAEFDRKEAQIKLSRLELQHEQLSKRAHKANALISELKLESQSDEWIEAQWCKVS